ncbi:helix-turn-helix domain-containing protein [Paracoccus sp. SCSIO 75233]|uniref:helix-turn-helix domain-containing protein n=1 Tax=Paracoccus sp. SCSIO 75233 TaxID=3017782 RepID=UPI0022EFF085|nr:XRE family transcriptional regulator [Paracoccus sp. SCSIO 75233]WBU51904.1 XRE family transcriptional regulator [Paracoccus sp. SCSIO 75233]
MIEPSDMLQQVTSQTAISTSNIYAHHIGARIGYFRDIKGMSLSELSRRSGIAKGTLSKLETGRGNPTVMTLAALARVLQVTPSDFLSTPPSPGEDSLQPLSGPGIDMRFLHRMAADSIWEVYETVIPKSDAPIVSKTHGGIEHLLMLSGEAEVGPSEAPVLLQRGQHIAFAGEVPHLYWAQKQPALVFLIMEYSLSSDAVTNGDDFRNAVLPSLLTFTR